MKTCTKALNGFQTHIYIVYKLGLKKDDEESDDEIDFPIPVWQSEKGFNDEEIILMWIDEVLLPYLKTLQWYNDGNPALLIMDAAGCHWTPDVKARLEELNIHKACIRKSLTFRFQCIEVIVVALWKAVLSNLWAN